MADLWDGLAVPANSAQSTSVAPDLWDGFAVPADPVQSGAQPTIYDEMLNFLPHQAGILSKNVVKGATFLPTALANIPAAAANGIRGVADWAFGVPQSSPSVPYVNPYGEGADVIFGKNAQPNNAAERVEGDTIAALAGAGSGVKLGQEALQSGGNFIAPSLANFLAYKPAIQYQAATGGAVSGSTAKELGFGPKMQTAIALAGGLAAPATVAGFKGAAGALQPFTDSGKNTIVNNTIAKYATDPQAAISALQNSPDYVPGFVPTGGTSSGDTGLIGLERTLQQQPESDFANRYLHNNAAVNNYFTGLSGTPADVAALESARDTATAPLYQQAAGQPISISSVEPVLANIDAQIAKVGPTSDAGQTLIGLKGKIAGAISNGDTSSINELLGMSAPSETTAPLSHVAQIYREQRDALNKSGMQPGAYSSQVRNAITPANMTLGATLEQQSPEFEAAQSLYRDQSQPITQMQNMQAIGNKLTGGTTDASGNPFFSPAKTGNLIKDPYIKTEYNGWQSLDQALSAAQNSGLQNVNNELQRANLVNTAAATKVGSNTFNNLASTNALTNLTGGHIVGELPVIKGLYSGANDGIKQKLIQAILTREATLRALQSGKVYNPMDTLSGALLKNGGLSAYMSQAGNAINGYNQ